MLKSIVVAAESGPIVRVESGACDVGRRGRYFRCLGRRPLQRADNFLAEAGLVAEDAVALLEEAVDGFVGVFGFFVAVYNRREAKVVGFYFIDLVSLHKENI